METKKPYYDMNFDEDLNLGSMYPIYVDKIMYLSTEHFFHSKRCIDQHDQNYIKNLQNRYILQKFIDGVWIKQKDNSIKKEYTINNRKIDMSDVSNYDIYTSIVVRITMYKNLMKKIIKLNKKYNLIDTKYPIHGEIINRIILQK